METGAVVVKEIISLIGPAGLRQRPKGAFIADGAHGVVMATVAHFLDQRIVGESDQTVDGDGQTNQRQRDQPDRIVTCNTNAKIEYLYGIIQYLAKRNRG